MTVQYDSSPITIKRNAPKLLLHHSIIGSKHKSCVPESMIQKKKH